MPRPSVPHIPSLVYSAQEISNCLVCPLQLARERDTSEASGQVRRVMAIEVPGRRQAACCRLSIIHRQWNNGLTCARQGGPLDPLRHCQAAPRQRQPRRGAVSERARAPHVHVPRARAGFALFLSPKTMTGIRPRSHALVACTRAWHWRASLRNDAGVKSADLTSHGRQRR